MGVTNHGGHHLPPHYDVVCLSHLRWAFVFQRTQNLLTRCARDRRVFYAEEPTYGDGDWAPLEGDAPRLDIHPEREGVVVATPRLPAGTSPEKAVSMQQMLIDELFVEREIESYVLWYHTPTALPVTRHLRPLATVYDCIDEPARFPATSERLAELEAELLERAHLVFTDSATLYAAKQGLHPSVHLFPSVGAADSAVVGPDVADVPDQAVVWDRTWERMAALVDSATALPSPSRQQRPGPFDYLVVGAGYAGSVLAERLAGAGKDVLVIDRRPHIAGNAFDHYDEAGILVHRYGPHIFHTNSERVFRYLSRFTEWRPYEHRVRAYVDGKLLPMPINLDTVNELYGLGLTSEELVDFLAERAEPVERARTSEDVVVGTVGRDLYETFFRGYTRKQWGLDPSELDASVTARVPTRTNRDDRYFTDEFQAMPRHGFTRMFERMLDHPNIKVMLNTDLREVERLIPYRRMIYTGPIDEFYDFCYGKLPYRSLDFRFETHDLPVFQAAPVVNYPNDHEHTRVTEFKYLTGQDHPKTSVVYEYPQPEGDPYYPVPRPENAVLYKQYKELADATPEVEFVGRLATYKYYNMDQVVAQALAVFDRITGRRREEDRAVGIAGPLRAATRAVSGAGAPSQ